MRLTLKNNNNIEVKVVITIKIYMINKKLFEIKLTISLNFVTNGKAFLN